MCEGIVGRVSQRVETARVWAMLAVSYSELVRATEIDEHMKGAREQCFGRKREATAEQIHSRADFGAVLYYGPCSIWVPAPIVAPERG